MTQLSSTEVPTADPSLALLNSRRLMFAGLTVVALVLAALVSLMVFQYREDLRQTAERHELLARMLEDHAARTLDATALGLSGLATMLVKEDPRSSTRLQTALQHTLASLQQLRSVAVLDSDGQVLAIAGEVQRGSVDLSALAPLPDSGKSSLAHVITGRGLPRRGATVSVPTGLTVLPFTQAVSGADGSVCYLVALLNPDFFANFQKQTLSDPSRSAVLARFDGETVAATWPTDTSAPPRLQSLPPISTYLPATNQASWIGQGLAAGQRVASFRALRAYPLWVMVDDDKAGVLRETLRTTGNFLAAGVVVMAVLLALTLYASSAQQAREMAQQDLAAAQAGLAQRAQELDALIASVHGLIFRTDAQGRVQLINARWSQITHHAVEEALGQAMWALVAPESSEVTRQLFEAGDETKSREAEVLVEAEGGHKRRLEVTVVPLRAQGRLIGFAGSAVDMTDLLASQAQLKAQLVFNATLIESNPLPVVLLDTHSRYLRVNRAWEMYTGRSRDEVVGTLAALAHAPDVASLHDAKDLELLRGDRPELQYEARIARADGQLRDIFVTKALIQGPEGRPVGILAAFMDISEFREAERMTRRARDAAEEMSRAKSEFIANISHELRTPLQAILGFSELGVRRNKAEPRAAAMFSDVNRAGRRMLALVNDLLDLSKLERGGADLDLLRQDLKPLLREATSELQVLAQERAVQLEINLDEAPHIVDADARRLTQVFSNILANAVRFSPPHQTVSIQSFVLQEDGHWIEVRISDRGPGIPPAELERIFDAFVQSSHKQSNTGGTGLGLTISRRIVQAHGGRLWAENRPEGGAVFVLSLPAVAWGETSPAPMLSAA